MSMDSAHSNLSGSAPSGDAEVQTALSDGTVTSEINKTALSEDPRVEVELRLPAHLAELHREIGDAGINAILRMQLKRGQVAEPASAALLKRAAGALRGALNEAARHTCPHEETHRGGAIWEICDWCGAKWADDEGGKPAYKEPKALTEGYEVLALLDAASTRSEA